MAEPATAPEGEKKKLWGGRFTGKTDPLMEKFNESLPFDKRMWREDIKVRGGKGGGRRERDAWERGGREGWVGGGRMRKREEKGEGG